MDDILSALNSHPDAARIRSKKIADGVATLIVDSSTMRNDERKALEARLREAAGGIAGVSEVRIAMTAARKGAAPMIAIGSGKGGVGKSTVTANLAVALVRMGKKVGLIDADIYGPSQPTLLAAPQRPEAKDNQLIPVETPYGVKLLSVGQLVPAGQALAWRGPMASSLGPMSGLVPIRLMWSVIAIRRPGVTPARSEPAALVSRITSAPSARSVRTGTVSDVASTPS